MVINMRTVTIEIPESFRWVVEYMKRWYEEQNDGDISLKFKDGGISTIFPTQEIKPKKGKLNES